MTLERLAFESEHSSKGHLSDIEHGRVVPTVASLRSIAESLGVLMGDLVNFPEQGVREQAFELSRGMSEAQLVALVEAASRLVAGPTGEGEARSGGRSESVAVVSRKPRVGAPVLDLMEAARAIAAGAEASRRGWVRVEPGEAGLPGVFAARIEGRAMAPRVPDGAIALFRRPGPGNRMGRVVVIAPGAGHRASAGLLRLVDRAPDGQGLVLRVLVERPSGGAVVPYQDAEIVAELVRVLGVPHG